MGNKSQKFKLRGYFYLALCILLWALIPVVSKKILSELDNYQMLFYSTVFSFFALLIVLISSRKISLLKKYSFQDYLIMFSLGFLGAYLYYVLLYAAFEITTAQEGFILAYTWPIMVLLLAIIILKEKITLIKIVSVVISFFGIIIIISHGKLTELSISNFNGNILAILGAFTFALFSVLGKKYNFDKTVSCFIYFFSALLFISVTVIFREIKIPSLTILLWLIFNGLFVNGITYVFWFKALEYGETHIISNALYLTPFVSLVYIYFFLNEKIFLSSAIGLLIIIFGIFIQAYSSTSISKNT